MSAKERIIKMILENTDEKLLQELENRLMNMGFGKKKKGSKKSDKVLDINESYQATEKYENDYGSGSTVSSVDTKQATSWLKKIADSGGVKSINDPVIWQRELRKDRSISMD